MAIFKQAASQKEFVWHYCYKVVISFFDMEIFKSSPCQKKNYDLLVAVARLFFSLRPLENGHFIPEIP
jgi:hypothetical protein